MTPAIGNWYDPEGDGYRPPWAGLSLLDLLEQFRKRIVRACLAIAFGTLIAFSQINPIVAFVFAPMRRALRSMRVPVTSTSERSLCPQPGRTGVPAGTPSSDPGPSS